jgi:hypothetical protein
MQVLCQSGASLRLQNFLLCNQFPPLLQEDLQIRKQRKFHNGARQLSIMVHQIKRSISVPSFIIR